MPRKPKVAPLIEYKAHVMPQPKPLVDVVRPIKMPPLRELRHAFESLPIILEAVINLPPGLCDLRLGDKPPIEVSVIEISFAVDAAAEGRRDADRGWGLDDVPLTVSRPIAARGAHKHAGLRTERVPLAPVRQPERCACAKASKEERAEEEEVIAQHHRHIVMPPACRNEREDGAHREMLAPDRMEVMLDKLML